MKFATRVLLATLVVQFILVPHLLRAQTNTEKPQSESATSPDYARQMKNMQAYVQLLREDVRQQKAEIMGSVMVLSSEDAAKFWPIYSDYDKELTKLNDQRVENIKEYARTYDNMSDEKADELIQKAWAY